MHSSLTLKPIGVIRTSFTSKYAAPRQPATAAVKSEGIITLDAGSNFEQALEDLIGFDYLWVIFWFHQNPNWKPKVLPPHGGRTKRGVFATRSPHRPNPIGLSLCRLLEVKGRTLRIENPDMLDGTPVLDLKPYLPHAESIPDARSGWTQQMNEQTPAPFRVTFAPEVRRKLDALDETERNELRSYLCVTLARDPRPHAYRRIKRQADGSYMIAVKRWRFQYTIAATTVRIKAMGRERDGNGGAA